MDKAELRVADRPLLDYALSAVGAARTVVVVGPRRELPAGILAAREDPPGGGPVAGIAAGLHCLTADLIVVLACDMPLLDASGVQALAVRLAAAGPEVDGVWYADAGGRAQPLAAAYRASALRAALETAGPPSGLPMRAVVTRLAMHTLDADADITADCDTWRDVAAIRSRLEGT